ncbi:MAG: hypothetical protein K2K65_07395 [Duncaniella sp.]|nr:hypothetical protein [Duncaniella sp.]
MTEEKKPGKFSLWFDRTKTCSIKLWEYCSVGVWKDKRDTAKVNIIKTLNLTVRSFMSTDLQSSACALTYRTLLAIVPALALLFAIGRGFGFQNLLQSQLYQYSLHSTEPWRWHFHSWIPVWNKPRRVYLWV